MSEICFNTKSLKAIPLKFHHATALFLGLSDSALFQFIPQYPPKSVEEVESRLQKLSRGKSSDGSELWLNWLIIHKNKYTPIGTLEATVRANERSATLAYFVFLEHQRKGYAKEACSQLINLLFENQTRQIFAYVDTRNIASIELAKSIGMKKIETVRKADFFKGSHSDEFIFCIEKRFV